MMQEIAPTSSKMMSIPATTTVDPMFSLVLANAVFNKALSILASRRSVVKYLLKYTDKRVLS